jgi:hypothetical protein
LFCLRLVTLAPQAFKHVWTASRKDVIVVEARMAAAARHSSSERIWSRGFCISMLALCLFILSFYVRGISALSEQFHESLSIRPLRDGKVITKFSFTSGLMAAPRNPESLDQDDRCEFVSYEACHILTELTYSTALHRFPSSIRSNTPGVRSYRTPSHIECWKVEL